MSGVAAREFALIDRFVRTFRRQKGARVVLGPGDDAALLRPTPGMLLCATTDAICEGVHYGPRFRPDEIGHKALAVNLSDLAAMGADPRWFLVALGLRPGTSAAWIDGVARGMARLARRFDCALVGGNITRATRNSLTLTVLGEVPEGQALRRDGLKPGHALVVTGSLGGSALGLRLLRRGRSASPAVRSQLRPVPQVAAGRIARGVASAAIDVSDGLAPDLAHLCVASDCGAEIWERSLPLGPGVAAQPDALSLALTGGEDYQLLLGVPPRRWPALHDQLAASGVAATRIGRAIPRAGLWIARVSDEKRDEKPRRLSPLGFQHF
jgi:thiamine-monophosphate kinase